MMGVAVHERDLFGLLCVLACLAILPSAELSLQDTTMAALLAATSTRRFRGVGGLLGGLVAGAAVGAVIGYAAVTVLDVPLSLSGAVSLGVALGGGVGVVSNYLVTGDEEASDETMTVDRTAERPEPTPADLFDDHPDPILYVADEGHGPVVRAANAAYGERFDVPVDAVIGAPLDEALLAEDTASIVDAVTGEAPLDTVATCETGDGRRQFRLRTAGSGAVCYLVYTPTDTTD